MRGLGIALVVLVHVLGVDEAHGLRKLFVPARLELRAAYDFIHSFNMAVMVMGSGAVVGTLGRETRSFTRFLGRKAHTLLVPLGVWAPLLMGLQSWSSRGLRGPVDWREGAAWLAAAWSPAQSIFWFVHVLFWCTLARWLFQRLVGPRLGRWSAGVYVAAALLLHLGASGCARALPPAVGDYLTLWTYWNRFFGLGLWVGPLLPEVCRRLGRLSPRAHGLLTLSLLGALGAIHAGLPREVYALTCGLNGPLGFGLLLSLAVLLRRHARGWHVLVHLGTHSMPFYLFHLYFVSGARICLERWLPGTPLAAHLVLGCALGGVGPWLFFKFLEPLALFRWSVGLPSIPGTSPVRDGAPHAEGAAISSA